MPHGVFPKVRTHDVVMTELDGELLVYDLVATTGYCLNRLSAAVWNACDGRTSVADIAVATSTVLGEQVDERLVWLAVTEFKNDGLLEEAHQLSSPYDGMSRREAVKTIGLFSASLPVLYAFRVPVPAVAGTTCSTAIGNCTPGAVDLCICLPPVQPGSNSNPDGCPCLTNGDCTGNCSCANPCTAGTCPTGETCQSGQCRDENGGGSLDLCNGTCPVGTTCITDTTQSNFGSCSGVCPPGDNVCVDSATPPPVDGICISGDTQNRNPDCCPCNNVEGCANCCNDGVCGPCIG